MASRASRIIKLPLVSAHKLQRGLPHDDLKQLVVYFTANECGNAADGEREIELHVFVA
jgi:hypothetical protein